MLRFLLTLCARAVAAGGSILFFGWLATATPSAFSSKLTIIISMVAFVAFASTLGLYSVALRLISRVPPKWKWSAFVEIGRISCVAAALSAAISAGILIGTADISGMQLGHLQVGMVAAFIVLNTLRVVMNDALRAFGALVSVAWFEFGQITAAAGLVLAVYGAAGGEISISSALTALIAASAVMFIAQVSLVWLLGRPYREVSAAPSLRRLILAYWRSVGGHSWMVSLLGSASRDLCILLYAPFAVGRDLASIALALRIWDGLSIPLVAAHSDIAAAVAGKATSTRELALQSLQRRVLTVSLLTVVFACGACIWLVWPSFLPVQAPTSVRAMIVIAAISRVISGAVGLPVTLLSFLGAARRISAIAVFQIASLAAAILTLRGALGGVEFVLLWCVSFNIRTVWEYLLLKREYGIDINIALAMKFRR